MNSQRNNPFPFRILQEWYKKNGRHSLPWRQIYHLPDKERLYHVWVAEVMLQQTQVNRVIEYYIRFLGKYPTIESLANTTYEELFPYYQWLGYYSRAKRMIELARTLVEKYDGVFPDNFEELRKLPWIGAYTAQALLGFWYDKSVLAIDANLEKIFARYYFWTKFKKNTADWWYDFDWLIDMLQSQIQKEKISGREINNALMDFWALISTSFDVVNRDTYPLQGCLWFQTEWKNEFKQKKIQIRKTKNRYYCLVFLHENHQLYWSSHEQEFEPFLIAPIAEDDRISIQEYFSATYGLEVSVRPSFWYGNWNHTSCIIHAGSEEVKLFHAQIQTGKNRFKKYPKDAKEEWIRKNIQIQK